MYICSWTRRASLLDPHHSSRPQLPGPPPPHWSHDRKLLLVVAELHGQSVADTAERGGLHLPVVHRVVIETDGVVEGLLHAEGGGAKGIHLHLADVVGVQGDHLWEGEESRVVMSHTQGHSEKEKGTKKVIILVSVHLDSLLHDLDACPKRLSDYSGSGILCKLLKYYHK